MRVFLDEMDTWIGWPSKADCPPHVGGHHLICWGHEYQKQTEKGWILRLSQDMVFFCPHTRPWAFELGLGLISLALLVPRFWIWTRTTPWLPELPAFRRYIVGLLSLHNLVSQSLIINFFLHIYISYWLFLWRGLTNIPTYLKLRYPWGSHFTLAWLLYS